MKTHLQIYLLLSLARWTISDDIESVKINSAGLECRCEKYMKCNDINYNDLKSRANDRHEKCLADEVCCVHRSEVPLRCGVRIQAPSFLPNKPNVAFGEFPWTLIVLMRDTNEPVQQAALIHPKAALTVASPLVSLNDIDLKVRAGEYDNRNQFEPIPHQERKVSTIVRHPRFNAATKSFDAALLILETQFTLTETIQPICLPSMFISFDGATECSATGWGRQGYGMGYSFIMKNIQENQLNSATCRERNLTDFGYHNTFLCAESSGGTKACEGDVGAPLVCPVMGARYMLAGLFIWGNICSRDSNENSVDIYAQVARIRGWIDKAMSDAGLDSSSYIMRTN